MKFKAPTIQRIHIPHSGHKTTTGLSLRYDLEEGGDYGNTLEIALYIRDYHRARGGTGDGHIDDEKIYIILRDNRWATAAESVKRATAELIREVETLKNEANRS